MLNIKRGDTFSYLATWDGAFLEELTSQIRDSVGKLVAQVMIEPTGISGTFRFSVNDTTNWPIGTLFTDIERTANGVVISSETMTITVARDITHE